MKMDIDHHHHLVTVWLATEEQDTPLEPLYQHCRTSNYKVAVFRSGKVDLSTCTIGLLQHNRR